ncbi:MAG: hypothetical protein ACW97P_06845 [Candidatus Hodarchaeales archaeon]
MWLITDKTGMFKIPKSVYIRGTATVSQLTENKFKFALSHHDWLTRRIFKSLTKDGFNKSSLIQITPTKFITVGIFGSMNETRSFSVPEPL